jgi:hypothetical protein
MPITTTDDNVHHKTIHVTNSVHGMKTKPIAMKTVVPYFLGCALGIGSFFLFNCGIGLFLIV